MTRVGITPPPGNAFFIKHTIYLSYFIWILVTITADDKRLKRGKPAPDPFLLAAACLGFLPQHCVVFEDSPSGIRAGVASGATVIAVCTSHPREKIQDCGAHFIVNNMDDVTCEVDEDDMSGLRLKFSVKH